MSHGEVSGIRECIGLSARQSQVSMDVSRPRFHSAVSASPPIGRRVRREDSDVLQRPLLRTPRQTNVVGDAAGEARSNSPDAPSASAEITKSVLFGLINSIVLVPVMIGFAQIIFRHEFFHKNGYMPSLVKLVLSASIVHQISFTALSSLPFAIGQVQDAGLIFLSAIASSVVEICQDNGASAEATMATVLITLSLCTCLLGLCLMLTGYFKLASAVQYLPMPVVGGYLAFIGLYCLEAGLSLMTGLAIDGPAAWPQIFHPKYLKLALPGVLVGILLLLLTMRLRHYLVLPTLLLSVPVIFFIVAVGMLGHSLAELRSDGWIDNDTSLVAFYKVWDNFRFSLVQWNAIPPQFPTFLGMYFVVAFSSSLDVAAIQMELGSQLDFNHELKTVGRANFVAGLCGGFTGSYIFSQTIFTMRNTSSRGVGVVLILCEAALFLLPFSILSYIPKLFFGGILTLIAIDLMMDWLIHSYSTMHRAEFAVLLASFLAINVAGLEMGMLIGCGIATLNFVVHFAAQANQSKFITSGSKRSNVSRGFEERALLQASAKQIAIVKVQGYIFFGSAVQLLHEVKTAVIVPAGCRGDDFENVLVAQESSRKGWEGEEKGGGEEETAKVTSVAAACRPGEQSMLLRRLSTMPAISTCAADDSALFEDSLTHRTRFLVLDCSDITALDATASRTCFSSLKQVMKQHNVCIVYCGLPADVARLLRGQQVLMPRPLCAAPGTSDDIFASQMQQLHTAEVAEFSDLDHGLEWCENALLASRGVGSDSGDEKSDDAATIADILWRFIGSDAEWFARDQMARLSIAKSLHSEGAAEKRAPGRADFLVPNDMEALGAYFTTVEAKAGAIIFERGDDTKAFFLIQRGSIVLEQFQVDKRVGFSGSIQTWSVSDALERLARDDDGDAGCLEEGTCGGGGGEEEEEEEDDGSDDMDDEELANVAAPKIGRRRRSSETVASSVRVCASSTDAGRGDREGTSDASPPLARVQLYTRHGIFGELDFFLGQPRSFRARAQRDSVLFRLSSRDFARLYSKRPDLCAPLLLALLRSQCLTVSPGDALQH